MAFSLGITTVLSTDKKSITISNEDTVWGDGYTTSSDFASMTLSIFGDDKSTALYEIELTDSEKNNFETGITLFFTDTRWFGDTYADDNYYVVEATVDELYTSDWEAFEVHLGLAEQIHTANATVSLRPQNLFEIQNGVQAVIALDTMENLSGDKYTEDREYRWRKLYSHIVDNIINKY